MRQNNRVPRGLSTKSRNRNQKRTTTNHTNYTNEKTADHADEMVDGLQRENQTERRRHLAACVCLSSLFSFVLFVFFVAEFLPGLDK